MRLPRPLFFQIFISLLLVEFIFLPFASRESCQSSISSNTSCSSGRQLGYLRRLRLSIQVLLSLLLSSRSGCQSSCFVDGYRHFTIGHYFASSTIIVIHPSCPLPLHLQLPSVSGWSISIYSDVTDLYSIWSTTCSFIDTGFYPNSPISAPVSDSVFLH